MFALCRTALSPLSRRAFSTTSSASASTFAKMSIIGRLADTPELQATSTGNEILRYSVATSTGPRENQQTSWFKVTAFLQPGAMRDYLTSLPKGSLVAVDCNATMQTYTDSEGKNRTALNLVQARIDVISKPKVSGEESHDS